MSNAELIARIRELVESGNRSEAELLAHLGEVDARRLYLEEGCPSMFVWCVGVLHFAEGWPTSGFKRRAERGASRSFSRR
jgi:hypothetical protein